MTQNEFEQRIGRKVSTEDYAKADAAYMASAMDKDAFCRDYKNHDCELVHDLAKGVRQNEVARANACKKLEELGFAIAEVANAQCNLELRTMAREALGMKKYVSLCLEKGYNLGSVDRDYILDHLRD